jgi:hypothetical protein
LNASFEIIVEKMMTSFVFQPDRKWYEYLYEKTGPHSHMFKTTKKVWIDAMMERYGYDTVRDPCCPTEVPECAVRDCNMSWGLWTIELDPSQEW